MIIVSRARIIIFLVFNLLLLLALGIFGYLFLTGRLGAGLGDGQLTGEILLIIAGGAAVLSLVLAVHILRSGQDAIRNLQKTIRQYQQLSVDFNEDSGIGKAGQKLLDLYRTLIEYNRKRTMKINSLSLLTRFLVTMSPKAVGVLDSSGRIIYRNSSFEIGNEKSGPVKINEVFTQLNFQAMLHRFFQDSAVQEHKHDGTNYFFVPIFAFHDTLSYIIVTDDQKARSLERGVLEKAGKATRPSIFDKFRKLFSAK